MLLVALTLAAWVIRADVQSLSREEIAAAIEQGRSGKTLQKRCSARGDNGLDFVVEGPVGRIMRAARKNRDFTVEDVTPTIVSAGLTVSVSRTSLYKATTEYVTPGMPGGLVYRSTLAIKSKPAKGEQAVVLEPVGALAYNNDHSTTYRAVIGGAPPAHLPPPAGSNLTASFDFDAFKAMPGKDVEVVVFMTDTGEHKCKISESERKALK